MIGLPARLCSLCLQMMGELGCEQGLMGQLKTQLAKRMRL